MAAAINESKFFDQEAYSDITIKFGARQLRCHKLILCSKSEYFYNLCGPGKKFAESYQPVIELKEDDEEAVASMLRWLYTFDYEIEASKQLEDQFHFHVNVCTVADKYGLPALKDEAFKRLVTHIEATEEDALVEIIRAVKQPSGGYEDEVRKVVQQVRDDRLAALLKNDQFRELLQEDPTECIALIDQYAIFGKLVEKKVGRCSCCNSDYMAQNNCPLRKCGNRVLNIKQCWVREG